MTGSILLIEDDPGAGEAMRKVLENEDYAVELVSRGDTGLERARAGDFDLVITDFKLPGLSGLDLVAGLREARPKLPVILMTAFGSAETVIEATKLGASDYVSKPFDPEELLALVRKVVLQARQESDPLETSAPAGTTWGIVGHSRVMQTLAKEIGRVAARPVTVLIRGATGTGKELVAKALCRHSDRASKAFLSVNCASLPPNLLESELFGHERGAFTGAYQRRIGRFEQAQGGTLFLDEIGDMSMDAQTKLLRVLQERVMQRLGGTDEIRVDVRILAATHRDLEAAIREKEFREDLYYRLSGVTLRLPTLVERREDIGELARHFLRRHAVELGVEGAAIRPEALALLEQHSWPGNVRELENVMRQVLLRSQPFAVSADHIASALAAAGNRGAATGPMLASFVSQLLDQAEAGTGTGAYWRMIEELEPELFAQAIKRAQGNQAKAARWLGVTRLKMREKLIELGLHPASAGSGAEPNSEAGPAS